MLTCFCDNAARLPLIYRVALDILPVQASSVPCKRVFSSIKETDTLWQSHLSPALATNGSPPNFEVFHLSKAAQLYR